jgi:hypothetical protein
MSGSISIKVARASYITIKYSLYKLLSSVSSFTLKQDINSSIIFVSEYKCLNFYFLSSSSSIWYKIDLDDDASDIELNIKETSSIILDTISVSLS